MVRRHTGDAVSLVGSSRLPRGRSRPTTARKVSPGSRRAAPAASHADVVAVGGDRALGSILSRFNCLHPSDAPRASAS